MEKIGIRLMVIGLLFSIFETIYYGSNWLPSCTSEIICDLISILLIDLGLLLYIYNFVKNDL